ncbi:MAG: toll/interleukin-1 receptor domain-containing protein, partial [Acetatifactor sp.]|nr:toll/interleukin-1 receptor domain-containing protein [Acetatifactor sp.]
MKDFFVSYTGTDLNFATWVAETLESSNYTVTIQAWDFRPGDNFVSKINEALLECKRLIVILSQNYLKSKWCEAEWTSKLAEQIESNERRIIPIRVEPVDLKGLLSPIVYIDIVDKTEAEAKEKILQGIEDKTIRKSSGFPSYYSLEHLEIDTDYYIYEKEIIYIKTCKSKVLTGGKDRIHNRITWFA